MAACNVDANASPQFSILVEHWRKKGYPSAKSDLDAALSEIRVDIKACNQRIAQRFSAVLGAYRLFKYRYKNTAAGIGARGGWRFYALFDRAANTIYPILPYPKKMWDDAPDNKIIECIREMVDVLKQRELPEDNSN